MKGRGWYWLLAAVLVGSVVFLAACNGGAASEPEPVKIGVVYPLSGSLASTGQDLKQGVELAVDIVNNRYEGLNLPLAENVGILGGRKVEVVFADHEGKPAKGRIETERLITQEHVVALMGAYNSSVTKAASLVAENAGVPFLSATSSTRQLTARGFKWFFRTTPHDGTFAESAFRFFRDLNDQKGADINTVALIYEDTDFGRSFANLARSFAKQYGFDVVADVSYNRDAPDVSTETAEVKAANPDAVVFVSYVSDAILYMKTFKRMGVAPKVIWANDAGFIASGFLESLGADGEYITSREVWAADLAATRPLVGQVNDLYRQKYGMDMNGNAARAFTGMLVLADAINRAGSTEPEAIRQALTETNIPADQLIVPWQGVRFDARGQNMMGAGIIVQVLNGKYTTVWPFNLAAADVVYPFPPWDER